MGFDERVDRAGVVGSCQDLLRFQAMFARHFAGRLAAALGSDGDAAIRHGLQCYGQYRGRLIRDAIAAAKEPVTAQAIARHWDMADLHLLTETGGGTLEGSPRALAVTIRDGADWERWREYDDGVAIARLVYAGVLPGLADALGATVAFDIERLDLARPWTFTITVPNAPDGPAATLRSAVFDSLEAGVALARRTSMNNGALYYFTADAATRVLDMPGEAAVRAAVRALAHERADRQKQAHLAAGWPLNVKTLMEHWDGQLVSIWQFEPGLLTEGTWHQDCSWCPYAQAWRELGPRALDLGYIYDYELHPTYYRRYHPDMTVQFEAIKTRGDSHCKFRISMPTKQKPGEPGFKGYTGQDV
ncbi:MAG: L-2-amino-thiazoline-4-carboxylic acid hydrolase [Alphaproteobacteria bacterium]